MEDMKIISASCCYECGKPALLFEPVSLCWASGTTDIPTRPVCQEHARSTRAAREQAEVGKKLMDEADDIVMGLKGATDNGFLIGRLNRLAQIHAKIRARIQN